MGQLQEILRLRPCLAGHSILIVDSPVTAMELYAILTVNQQMKVIYVNEAKFYYFELTKYLIANNLQSCAIHVPGVADTSTARDYLESVTEAYRHCPRMVILEGSPATSETANMYEKFRENGLPMATKFSYLDIVEKLAELFTNNPPV